MAKTSVIAICCSTLLLQLAWIVMSSLIFSKKNADREVLQNEEAAAREIGVNGVPTFIVANKHVVTGAQPPELWGTVLEELSEQAAQQTAEA